MGSAGSAGTRRLLRVLALSAVVIGALATLALAAGPGGWDHLGDRGTPGTNSLDLVASALAVTPGALYVGGEFTDAGGDPQRGPHREVERQQLERGQLVDVADLERERLRHRRARRQGLRRRQRSRTRAANANADFLAVWDGASWEPFCTRSRPAFERERDQPADHRPDALRRRATSRTARASRPPTTCSPATWPPAPRAPRSSIRPTRSPARCTR